jgi:hypothetical protein
VDIDAVIDEHGWALQGVFGDGPGQPHFTYTVGLFDRLPELLCVGPCAEISGPTLNALAEKLLARPELAQLGQRIELPGDAGVLPVIQLGAVDPRWRARYVLRATAYHRTEDIEVLQVLAPDPDGRFPDDPAIDRHYLSSQPVLADPEQPWRVPHGEELIHLLAEDGRRVKHAVLLPIVAGGEPIGREELVPARPSGDDWHLIDQPSLADWCVAGEVVAADPCDVVIPGAEDVEVVRYQHVVDGSPRMVLRWGARFRADDDIEQLERVLARPRFADEVVVGFGAVPHALTFAVPPRLAEPLRIALRPLERDGILVPRSLFHQAEDPDLVVPHPHCPDCQASR